MFLDQKIHFIGIGGIGMSAIARFCSKRDLKLVGVIKVRIL